MIKNVLRASMPLLLLACNEQKESNEDRLARFYSWYIHQATSVNNRNLIDKDILEAYCSPSFLKNTFYDASLDFDPLLSAEKFQNSWAESISVMNGRISGASAYRVHFIKDKKNHSHNILVTLEKARGHWRIVGVKEIK